MSPSWINRIRSLPLFQRHLIMWGGSLLLFSMVAWLWLAQVKAQLASLNSTTPFALSTPAPVSVAAVKKPVASSGPADEFVASLKNIGNAFFSLFGHTAPSPSPSPEQSLPATVGQSDELNQHLPYQPFPDN